MGSKQMNKHGYTALATVLGLMGIVVGDMNSAFAEPAAAASVALEEVVVSARRKEENLQKVPVSVIAFTEKDLRKNSISNLQDVGAQSANVMIMPSSNAGASAASIYIRGIGQFDEIVTTDPGVGVYIDGVYFARTTGALLNIGDFQRVEVLRGPQGTLFGKNTIGGAVNITTKKPEHELGGYIDASYGRFDRIDVKGAFNMPIIADTLSARVSASSVNADGFAHQANGVDTGNKNTQGIRGQLRWTPSTTVDVVLSADKSRIDERLEPRSTSYIDPTAPIAAGFNLLGSMFPELFEGAPDFGPQYLSPSPYLNYATGENTNKLDAWGTSLHVSWQLNEDITLTSITSYRSQESRSALDGDATPTIFIQFNEEIDQNQFSHEAQVKGVSFGGKLDWVTGVIYFYEDADMVTDSFQVPDLRFFIGDTSRHDIQGIKNNSIGVFAEGTYHVTDQFSATLGLRYTYEKKKWTHDLRQQYFGASLIPPGTETESWNPVTPKVGLQYRPTEDVMTYVSLSRGFRSGGFNGRANTLGVQSFDPEFVWTYEAGFKSQWFDNTLRLNGAAFYNDYRDLQILVVTATQEGGFEIFTRNAAKAKTQGFELEMLAAPVEGLELSGSVGYLDAKIKKSESPAIPAGNRLQMSPEWSFNLGAQYTVPIESFGNASFRIDWAHKSKIYYNAENSDAIADDFSSLNARVSFLSEKGWELAGFVTNLTNAHNAVGGFDAPGFGFGIQQWGRPREYGISVRAEF